MMAATYLVGHVPVRRPVDRKADVVDFELSRIRGLARACISAHPVMSVVCEQAR